MGLSREQIVYYLLAASFVVSGVVGRLRDKDNAQATTIGSG